MSHRILWNLTIPDALVSRRVPTTQTKHHQPKTTSPSRRVIAGAFTCRLQSIAHSFSRLNTSRRPDNARCRPIPALPCRARQGYNLSARLSDYKTNTTPTYFQASSSPPLYPYSVSQTLSHPTYPQSHLPERLSHLPPVLRRRLSQ